MILLPPADLDQDEAVFRIVGSLQRFREAADSLLSRISSRTEELNVTYEGLDIRLKRVQRKIDMLRKTNTSGILTCPSRFPVSEYCPASDLTPTIAERAKEEFKPKSRTASVVDMRRELETRKRFYLPSQLMGKIPEQHRKERQVPARYSFADMFYNGTDELAFGKRSSKLIKFVRREKSDTTSSVDVNIVDASALGGRGDEKDPLEYVPELGPLEDLDLPDILPDLPGIAEDLTLLDCDIAKPVLPDLPVLAKVGAFQEITKASGLIPRESKEAVDASTSDAPLIDSHCAVELAPSTEKKHAIEETPVANEPEPSMTREPFVALPIPPPPAPPPPPPPNLITSITSMGSSSSPAPLGEDRSDLMAAIRAAGGAGKAKLKSISSSRRAAKESESLGTSALSENKSSSGNDLMTSLAKALEARRKAIAGMGNAREQGSSREGKGDNSADDEWK